jgi:inward rectifier potassium channel
LLIKYHEESFFQKVYQIQSYDFANLQVGARFKLSSGDEEGITVLKHDALSGLEKF